MQTNRGGGGFRLTLQVFVAGLFLAGCASVPVSEALSLPESVPLVGGDLRQLLDDIEAWEKAQSPLSTLYDGEHPRSIAPLDQAALPEAKLALEGFRERLKGREGLTAAVLNYKLTDQLDRSEFGAPLIPMTAEGGFYNALNFVLPRLPFDTVADYEAYLSWLPSYASYLDSHLPLLQRGINLGRVPAKVVVNNNVAILQTLIDARFAEHPNVMPLRSFPATVTVAEQNRLAMLGEQILDTELRPAYERLASFLTSDYMAAASSAPGISNQPGGREYYANRVRHFTTLPLTPDQVFDLGEREVARIAAAMEVAMQDAGFDGTRTEFIDRLRRSPEFYPESAESLLARAAWIAKTIEGKLPGYFSPLYRLPFTIEPVPATIAPSYTSGRYLSGDLEQGRPGIYWVNTTRLESRALYSLPALTLHEAVPGHHLQHARAADLEGVHPFRQEFYISAFGEGWGLYAEYLGEEMGIYATAYERFGRLSYEMWRACRLVVDVGLHDRGWTRQEAIDYLAGYTALSKLEVANEIDRYIGWPGQALAYKLGELVIKGLRREAEQQLGDAFDIKAFHEAVLGNGSLPLSVLIDSVRAALKLSGKGLPLP